MVFQSEVTRTIYFFLNGRPIRWEISEETHWLLKKAMEKTGERLQNIVALACKKYGERESSILKYIRRDLAKRPK